MSNLQKTVRLDALKTHPAQMRTAYNLQQLAELIIKIYDEGLQTWQPILIGQYDNGKAPIISGHRRHLAVAFSHYLPIWLAAQGEAVAKEDVELSHAQHMLHQLIPHEADIAMAADVETAVSHALAEVGTIEIPAQRFVQAGDAQAELMALIGSNYGGEAPDVLGEAVSFQAALLEGKTPLQIARQIGKPVKYITNRVALVNIDQALAQLIVKGKFSLTVAVAVAGIEQAAKKAGLTRYILAKQDDLSVGEIGTIAKTLKAWQGLTMPLIFEENQTKRNMARILIRMWHNALANFPESTWAAAAMLIHRNAHQTPWLDQVQFNLWVQSFGNGTYFVDGRPVWVKLVHELLEEVSCESCPLAEVPYLKGLKNGVSQTDGPLGMPCRLGQKAPNCLHGFALKDAVTVRVPAAWAGLDGVEGDAGHYTVSGSEQFEAAQEAMYERETAEALAEVQQQQEETAAAKARAQKQATPQKETQTAPKPTAEKPIRKKRRAIRLFMESHTHLSVSHPWATPCASCQNRRDDSPVKDPNVPHCNWAKGSSTAHLNVWMPQNPGDKGPHVPTCRQYLPTGQWKAIIPETPAPRGISREWLLLQIEVHYTKASSTSALDEERPLLFLIGRNSGASDSNRDWFEKQLKKQCGELTDGQLWTLAIWTMNWWQGSSRAQLFPVLGNGTQLTPYKLVDFMAYAEKAQLKPATTKEESNA